VHVVIDALSARTGGGQTYMRQLVASQPPREVEVTVLAPRQLKMLNPASRLRVEPMHPLLVKPGPRAAFMAGGMQACLRRLGADVLFSPGGTLPKWAPVENMVTMCRSLLPFDSDARSLFSYGYQRARLRALERTLGQSMRRADLVIFVSEYARSLLTERIPELFRRSVVIHHGVAKDFRHLARAQDGHSNENPEGYVLYVSDLWPYKAQVEAVRAHRVLLDRRPDAPPLVLVGSFASRSYEREVRQEVKRLGLSDAVHLLGNIDHDALGQLYAGATVGLFLSRCENCPNILLEAMAAGVPIVSSDRAPMPEFGGTAVLYVNPSDHGAVAQAVESLLVDSRARAGLSQAAQERSRVWSWPEAISRTWNAILASANAP
jgi:glycosyltransferase involved in cell wall biosynthesis